MEGGFEAEMFSGAERLASLMREQNITQESDFETLDLSPEDCAKFYGDNLTLSNLSLMNPNCLLHAPTLDNYKIYKSLVLTLMAILSLIGNFLTMYNIRKSKRRRSGHIYSLLYHLSIADLCVTFWCIVGEAIWHLTVEWKAGVLECKFFKFAQMFSLYLSAYMMVLIGVDRFIAVKYPLKSMSKGMCFRLISFCWILSGILSLPQVVVFDVRRGPFQEPFYQCVTHGVYTAEWQEHLYTFFTLLFTFIIPLIILATTYLMTVCTLHRNEEFMDHSGSFRTLVDPNRRKIIRRAKMKSLRISLAIVCAFLICWTPYYVAMIVYLFSEEKYKIMDSGDLQSTVIFFFGMSNSLFNPIIYGIFHSWKPRRKELQRYNNNSNWGNSSTRKTLLTNLSFQRQRSGTMTNGTLVVHENNLNNQSHLLESKNRVPVHKKKSHEWVTSPAASSLQANTSL